MLEVNCPLRRHSFSAPGRLLDDCLNKLDKLSFKFDKVLGNKSQSETHSSKESSSVVNFILDQIMSKIISKMPQCHNCHRLLADPDHRGITPGISKCTLDHSNLCPV